MKKLSLNVKIIFVLSIFVVSCIVISAVGISRISEIDSSLDNLVKNTVPRALLAKTAEGLSNELRNQQKKHILVGSQEEKKLVDKAIEETATELEKKLHLFIELAGDEHKEVNQSLLDMTSSWKEVDQEVRKISRAGNNDEAFALAEGKSSAIMKEFNKVLDGIVERREALLKSESHRAAELVSNTKNLILTMSSISIILGLFLAFFILRAVNKAIDRVITSLDDSSSQVATAAQQIASTSEELSQATTEQASSLEETAASVEEMNSMINKNSENARNTSETSTKSQQNAQKGKETVELMIRSIAEINEANTNIMQQINHSNTQISEIVQVIAEIGNKTKVINDIVFQTKLLSFNASVEAARAGEHGKGFAVVAEEVGNLAEMSGNAAKEISAMLEGSIQKVEGIVNDTKASVERLVSQGKEKVEAGTRIAHECGQVLEEIVQNISSVTQMAGEISTASQEQAQGIGEITKAMAQLDQVTQQNSASSEEAASAAEELSAQAEVLKEGVRVLIETIRGAGDKQPAPVTVSVAAPKQSPAKAPVSQKAAPSSKVVHLRKADDTGPAKNSPLKKAAGDDSSIPSYDDDRFNDV